MGSSGRFEDDCHLRRMEPKPVLRVLWHSRLLESRPQPVAPAVRQRSFQTGQGINLPVRLYSTACDQLDQPLVE
jgi:hypothetical protein